MINIRLTISYDGSMYSGWQTQNSRGSCVVLNQKKTLQHEIETAIGKLYNRNIKLEASGRTDAGVHAFAQVANFRVPKLIMPEDKLKNALNALLPEDIFVNQVEVVSKNFHSRFDAASKIYCYVVINTEDRPIFCRSYGYWLRHRLDVPLMRKEARLLVGRHDFKSFQASDKIKRSSITTIYSINIRSVKNSKALPFVRNYPMVIFEIKGRGFLRGMVRNIVGTLIDIGRGKLRKGSMAGILRAKDRKSAGFCAPACGLFLVRVDYKKHKKKLT